MTTKKNTASPSIRKTDIKKKSTSTPKTSIKNNSSNSNSSPSLNKTGIKTNLKRRGSQSLPPRHQEEVHHPFICGQDPWASRGARQTLTGALSQA